MEDREQIPMVAEEPKIERIRRVDRYKDQYGESTPKTKTQSQAETSEKNTSLKYIYEQPLSADKMHEQLKQKKTKKEEKSKSLRRLGAALLAVGALVTWSWTSNKDGKDDNVQTPKVTTTTANTIIPMTSAEQFRMELAATSTPMPTVKPKTQLEKTTDRLTEVMSTLNQTLSEDTIEYRFFSKYSTTLNSNIGKKEGEITSIEEWLEVAEKDPQRFRTEGLEFLKKMSLDYMKLQIYDKYKNDSRLGFECPDDIKITYEVDEDGRTAGTHVRHVETKKGAENVGLNLIKQNIQGIPTVYVYDSYYGKAYGRENTKLDIGSWRNFISINELYDTVFEHDGTPKHTNYSNEQYRDLYLDYINFYIKQWEREIPTEREGR